MTLNVKIDLQIQFYDEKNVINISYISIIKLKIINKIIFGYCHRQMVQ
jgi:hypothetical protein